VDEAIAKLLAGVIEVKEAADEGKVRSAEHWWQPIPPEI
jgi:hypothetical protein